MYFPDHGLSHGLLLGAHHSVQSAPTRLLESVNDWQSQVLKFPASALISPSACCKLSLGNALRLLRKFSSRRVHYGPPEALSIFFLTIQASASMRWLIGALWRLIQTCISRVSDSPLPYFKSMFQADLEGEGKGRHHR